ncbi:hypothetical protein BJP36_03830 [Moorena producens JHB]|uniref:Uncharacterized protein n=1 Tax=Moorena producens (strain JHB) TaxID=1454205 RepID=A0A1D9FV14_MOOP1|nr:hypothetical protein [Moorena producens]AOY79171.1 hypothetical protein BJP36_03830 [Moorena producens JHB]
MKHIVAALTIVGITVAQGFTNKVIADQLPVGTVEEAQGDESPQVIADESPVGIVREVQGVGEIKRSNQDVSIPVSIDEKLYSGDFLRIDKGAYVVIECHNNNKWTIPEGILVGVNNGCGKPISRFSNPPEKPGFYPPDDALGPVGPGMSGGTR